jgi:hypothetical protein
VARPTHLSCARVESRLSQYAPPEPSPEHSFRFSYLSVKLTADRGLPLESCATAVDSLVCALSRSAPSVSLFGFSSPRGISGLILGIAPGHGRCFASCFHATSLGVLRGLRFNRFLTEHETVSHHLVSWTTSLTADRSFFSSSKNTAPPGGSRVFRSRFAKKRHLLRHAASGRYFVQQAFVARPEARRRPNGLLSS